MNYLVSSDYDSSTSGDRTSDYLFYLLLVVLFQDTLLPSAIFGFCTTRMCFHRERGTYIYQPHSQRDPTFALGWLSGRRLSQAVLGQNMHLCPKDISSSCICGLCAPFLYTRSTSPHAKWVQSGPICRYCHLWMRNACFNNMYPNCRRERLGHLHRQRLRPSTLAAQRFPPSCRPLMQPICSTHSIHFHISHILPQD